MKLTSKQRETLEDRAETLETMAMEIKDQLANYADADAEEKEFAAEAVVEALGEILAAVDGLEKLKERIEESE